MDTAKIPNATDDICLAYHADHGPLPIAYDQKIYISATQELCRLEHRSSTPDGDEALMRYR
jgi:hypothetical protein